MLHFETFSLKRQFQVRVFVVKFSGIKYTLKWCTCEIPGSISIAMRKEICEINIGQKNNLFSFCRNCLVVLDHASPLVWENIKFFPPPRNLVTWRTGNKHSIFTTLCSNQRIIQSKTNLGHGFKWFCAIWGRWFGKWYFFVEVLKWINGKLVLCINNCAVWSIAKSNLGF